MFFKKGKNKLKGGDDLDLDDFDMDDFDDFDDMDGEPRQPSKKDLAKTVGKAAAKEAGSTVRKGLTKDLIPGDFDTNIRDAKDLASDTYNLGKESLNEIKDTIGKVLPKGIREALGLSEDARVNQQRVDEAQAREAGIQNSLDQIFNKQKEQDDKKNKREIAVEVSKISLSKAQNELLLQGNNELAKISGFLTDIGTSYFRKSLELKYKSYYLQLDTLKLQTNYYKAFSAQLDKVVKNTGLPEHVKITQAERFDGIVKDAIAQKLYATAFTNNEFIQNFKRNVERKVKNTTSDIKDMIMGAGDMFSMGEATGDSGWTTGAKMGGGLLGGYLGRKIHGKLRPHAQRHLGDNKILQGVGLTAQNAMQNTATTVGSWRRRVNKNRENAEDATGLRGAVARGTWGLLGGALDLAKMKSRDTKFKEDRINDINAPAIFDNNVYRSIVDAIPMYLSRILQNTSDISGMYGMVNSNKLGSFKPSSRLVYNYVTRDLTSIGDYRNSINESLKGKVVGKNKLAIDNLTGSVSSTLSGDRAKNKRALKRLGNKRNKEKLSKYLDEFGGMEGIDNDFDKLFTQATGDNADPRIKAFLEENNDIKALISDINEGMKGKDASSYAGAKRGFKSNMEDVTSDYPIGSVKSLFEAISLLAKKEGMSNIPNDKQAEYIAIGFTRYLFNNVNDPIEPDMEVLRRVYGYLPKGTSSDTITILNVFTNDLDKIIRNGDYTTMETLRAAFGIMNNAIWAKINNLGDGADQSQELMQLLKNANPDLMRGQNKSSLHNIITGTIDDPSENGEDEGLDIDKIANIMDGSSKVSKQNNDFILNSKILGGVEAFSKGAKDAMGEGKGVRAKIANLVNYTKDESKKLLEEHHDNVKAKLDKIGSLVTDLTSKGVDKSIQGFVVYINGISRDLEALIAKEDEEHFRVIEGFEGVLAGLRENGGSDSEIEKIQKDINREKTKYNKRKAGYTIMNQKLTELRTQTASLLDTSMGDELINKVKKFRELLIKKSGELKDLIKVSKEENI